VAGRCRDGAVHKDRTAPFVDEGRPRRIFTPAGDGSRALQKIADERKAMAAERDAAEKATNVHQAEPKSETEEKTNVESETVSAGGA
jgi:hypothetical protein